MTPRLPLAPDCQDQPGPVPAGSSQAPLSAVPAGRRLASAGLLLLCLWPCPVPAVTLPASGQIRQAQSPFLPGSVPGRVAVARRMNASAAARCLGLAQDFYRWNELKPSARLLPGCELWLDDPCLLAQASPRPGPGLAAGPGLGQGALPACAPAARRAEEGEAAPALAGKAKAAPRRRQEGRRKPDSPGSPADRQGRQNMQGKPSSGKGTPGAERAAPAPAKPEPRGADAGEIAAGGKPQATARGAGAGAAPASLKDSAAGALLELRPGSCSAQLAAYLGELGWQLAWRLSRDIWIAAHAAYPGAPADALKRLFTDLARAGQPCRVTVYTANHVIEVRED